jgi:tight adherence protein C
VAAAVVLLVNVAVWGYALWAMGGVQAAEQRLARYAGRPGISADMAAMGGSLLRRLVAQLAGRLRRRAAGQGVGEYDAAEARAAGIDPARLEATKYLMAAVMAGMFALPLWLAGQDAVAILAAMTMGAAGYILPGIFAKSALRTRRDRILKALPDTLDMISVAMSAGLSFDHAIRTATANRQDPLSRILKTYLEEVQVGMPATRALGLLADRGGVPELRQVVAHIIESRKYGAPVAELLKEQAEHMRQILRSRQRERAARVSVQMLFPLVLCIFPVTFLATVAPILIRFVLQGTLRELTGR